MELVLVSDFKTRLREVLTSTQANVLAQNIGLSKQAISMYASGKRQPKRPTIEAIARDLGINPLWLIGYDVPKIIENPSDQEAAGVSDEDKAILKLFHSLPKDKRALVLSMIEAALRSERLLE